jgi:hypothetical protein
MVEVTSHLCVPPLFIPRVIALFSPLRHRDHRGSQRGIAATKLERVESPFSPREKVPKGDEGRGAREIRSAENRAPHPSPAAMSLDHEFPLPPGEGGWVSGLRSPKSPRAAKISEASSTESVAADRDAAKLKRAVWIDEKEALCEPR